MRKETSFRGPLLSALVVVLVACGAVVLVAQAPEELGLFEIRRQLIDRIEAAVTAGDAETLTRMDALSEIQTVEPEEAAEALRRAADQIEDADAQDGPTSVTAPIFDVFAAARCSAKLWERKQACMQGYSSCVMRASYPNRHGGYGHGLRRFNSYEDAVRQCEIDKLSCEIRAYEKFEICQMWATAIPG